MKGVKILFLLFYIGFLSANRGGAQISNNITIELQAYNASGEINDGYAIVNVIGGKEPYKYKWSEKSIDTTSVKCSGLTEGDTYSVTVTDVQGHSSSASIKIPLDYNNEKINYFFHFQVKIVSAILLADVFALLNIYEPILYDDNGNTLVYPNGDPKTMQIPLIVVWLIFGAVFFTIKMRFINIRGIKHAIELVQGKFDNPKDKGQISHFQALTTALSATVGLGNIAGVAIAVSYGGPGAVFWMILAGFLGMASKFTEAALGVKYRRIDAHGEVSGGPMYYLKYIFGFHKNGKKAGRILSVLFAVLLIGGSLGGGNMFQANQAFQNMASMIPVLTEHGVMFGIILAVLVGLVIIGGINSIAKVTSKIVPFMAGLYLIAALIIIFMNISQIGNVFGLIFNGAFDAPALKGGFIGVLIMGFRRAAFSNEAGIGSAAIAHSAVKTHEPVSEGIVALLEPFIDTVVICTLTAFVLLFTGYTDPSVAGGAQGSQLTSLAFGSVFPWFQWILLIAIFLFAYSTLISWSYYGQKGFDFIFGHYSLKWFGSRSYSTNLYKLIFLFFIVVGASSSLSAVIDFSDMMILSMAFPNIIGLIILAPRVKRDLDKYWTKLKNGEIKKYK